VICSIVYDIPWSVGLLNEVLSGNLNVDFCSETLRIYKTVLTRMRYHERKPKFHVIHQPTSVD